MWYDNNFSRNLERQSVESVKKLTNQEILNRINRRNKLYFSKEAEEVRRVLTERGWQLKGEHGTYSLEATREDAHDLQTTPVQCCQITVDDQGSVTTEQWAAE